MIMHSGMQLSNNSNLYSKIAARCATIHVARIFGAGLYNVSGFANSTADQPR